MIVETFITELMVVLFSAVFSYIACYIVYNRFSVAVWGFVAAFVPRIPVAIVAAAGGSNLVLFAWLSHSIGVFIYAIFLAIADVLLLEIAFIRVIRPFSFALPKSLQTAVRVESMLSRLQEYHAVPRPVRVQWVYGAGIIAGMINLVFLLMFGLL